MNGTQGPSGPASTIPGPSGPPGITFLNATNVYREEGPQSVIGPEDDDGSGILFATSFATCDLGDFPLNGASIIRINETSTLSFIGISEGNNVYVVWQDSTTTPDNSDIFYITNNLDFGTFGNIINISNNDEESFNPQISSSTS